MKIRSANFKHCCSFFVAMILCGTSAATEPAASADVLATDAKVCAALESKQFGPGRIVAATFVRPPFTTRWMNSSRTATVNIPFCRLEGQAEPVAGSHIGFEVWLPARSIWNVRLLGIGAGGSMGAVNTLDMASGINRRFAVVATDNGHRSGAVRDGNEWAYGHPERIVDFAYRAHHLSTVAAKALVFAYYGRKPQYAFNFGCSQGGHKGVMMAERYPEDYDGIVAGAPVYSWVDEMTFQAWTVRALTETPRSALSVEQLQLLQRAAVAQCGGPNGLVADPRQCTFDPGQLACPKPYASECLSPEQMAAVRKIYAGPETSNGHKIFPGFDRGGERGWEQLYVNVSADGSRGGGSWYGVYRYMVFDDPNWILPQLNFDRDPAFAKQKLGPVLDTDAANLGAFAKRGGKLVIYHGWADHQVPARSSIDYRDSLIAHSSRENVDRFMRLFMVPGMAHCDEEVVFPSSPAPRGPNLGLQLEYEPGVAFTAENDALTALEQWVENGRAPSQFIVRVQNEPAGLSPRTVRACAAPMQGAYRGEGDPLDAANWECR